MKKGKLVIGMLLSISVSALAQVPQTQAQVISQVVGQAVEVQQAPQAQVIQTQTAAPQSVIYIQKQAESVVEAAPLAESSADRIRRKRMEIEQATESKIVEKLEQERMKEEEVRANKIINGLENTGAVAAPAVIATPQAAVVAPVVLEPVQVVQPTVVAPVQAVAPVQTNTAAAGEVTNLLNDTKYFISANLGFISYPSADNVQTSGGMGVSFGMLFDRKYILEGGFLYSRAEVEVPTRPYVVGLNQYGTSIYPTIVNMSQYNYTGAFKYLMGEKRLQFAIGGIVSYTYRDYIDEQFFYPDYRLRSSSWAADMGLSLGAAVLLSKNFSIGADFKYMFNVTYDIQTSSGLQESKLIYDSFYNSPIEEVGYYNLLIGASYIF